MSDSISGFAGADDGVVFGSDDTSCYGVSRADGSVVWERSLGAGSEDWVRSDPAVVDGTAYVGSDRSALYALDAASGDREWRLATSDWVRSDPTVADGTVYADVAWSRSLDGSVSAAPRVVAGTLYVGTEGDTVFSVDASDGSPHWEVDVGDSAVSTPAVADGTLYVGSDDGTLYALDPADGEERFTYSFPDYVRTDPVVVGTVFAGSD